MITVISARPSRSWPWPGPTLRKPYWIELMADLPQPSRSLIETCLLDWRDGRAVLHPLVRDEVLSRHRLSGRDKNDKPWRHAERPPEGRT